MFSLIKDFIHIKNRSLSVNVAFYSQAWLLFKVGVISNNEIKNNFIWNISEQLEKMTLIDGVNSIIRTFMGAVNFSPKGKKHLKFLKIKLLKMVTLAKLWS